MKNPRPKLTSLSIASIAREAPKSERRHLEGLAAYCRKERLSQEEGSRDFLLFKFEAEVRAPRLTASGDTEMPYVPAEFRVWVGKKVPWVLTFDAGRRLSSVATSLLGYAISQRATSIRPVKFPKKVFEGVKDWALEGSVNGKGAISRVTLEGVESGRASFRQVVLRANGLESSPVFHDFFGSANAVSNMTFFTPKLRSASRRICCKLSSWGGITLYTPQTLDSEIEELVRAIDERFVA
jgi:hypothetical protein